jgi:DNA mismatch endonuclease (patch repair protein)
MIMDRVSKDVRSRVMASVKARGTRLEDRMLALLKAAGVRGYRRWARNLPGKPDFVFRSDKVALFVDSCFWHGCKRHLRMPASNVQYWKGKMRRNRRQDGEVKKLLSELGWRVVRVGEHEFDTPGRIVRKIQTALRKAAELEGVALNQLINVAVAEKVSALRTEEYFRERGRRANRAQTLRILRRAGKGNAPVAGDELPVEWQRKPGRRAVNGRDSVSKRALKKKTTAK